MQRRRHHTAEEFFGHLRSGRYQLINYKGSFSLPNRLLPYDVAERSGRSVKDGYDSAGVFEDDAEQSERSVKDRYVSAGGVGCEVAIPREGWSVEVTEWVGSDIPIQLTHFWPVSPTPLVPVGYELSPPALEHPDARLERRDLSITFTQFCWPTTATFTFAPRDVITLYTTATEDMWHNAIATTAEKVKQALANGETRAHWKGATIRDDFPWIHWSVIDENIRCGAVATLAEQGINVSLTFGFDDEFGEDSVVDITTELSQNEVCLNKQ